MNSRTGLRRIFAAVGAGGFALVFVCAFALSATQAAKAQLLTDSEARERLDEQQVQLRQFAAHIVSIRDQLSKIDEKLGAANQQLGRISQRLQEAETEIRELRGEQQEQSEISRRERTAENGVIRERITATEKQLANMRESLDTIRKEAAANSHNVTEIYSIMELPPEQKLYDKAVAEFRGQRYKSALEGFRRVQRFYPDGKFQVNVSYWISNVLLALDDYDAATAAANDLITRHPQSDKVPDAMLIMARSLKELGRENEGKKVLQRLIEKYATSLAADKARQEL